MQKTIAYTLHASKRLCVAILLALLCSPAFGADAGATAESLLEKHDDEGAMRLLQSRIDSNPRDVVSLRKAGCICLYLAKFQDALPFFSMALRVSPADKQLHWWRGVCLYRLRKTKLALADFLVAQQQPSLAVLRCYAKLGQKADAQRTLNALLKSCSWENGDDEALRQIVAEPSAGVDAFCNQGLYPAHPARQHGERAAAELKAGDLHTAIKTLQEETQILEHGNRTFRNGGIRYPEQQALMSAYSTLAAVFRSQGNAAIAKTYARKAKAVQEEMDHHSHSFYMVSDVFDRPEEGLEQAPDEISLSSAGYDWTKFQP